MSGSARKTAPKGRFEEYFAGSGLENHWVKLHKGDQEPYPNAARVTRLSKQHAKFAEWIEAHGGAREVAAGVQEAWRRFHTGNFNGAIAAGGKLGALGATAANKAAAIHSVEARGDEAIRLLEAAIARGEQAVESLPDDANAHYMLALALGRYSQRISIVKALASGIATRVREHLDSTVKLEPRHAEAQIALGLYHAEIVAKVGLAARRPYLSGVQRGRDRALSARHQAHAPVADCANRICQRAVAGGCKQAPQAGR